MIQNNKSTNTVEEIDKRYERCEEQEPKIVENLKREKILSMFGIFCTISMYCYPFTCYYI